MKIKTISTVIFLGLFILFSCGQENTYDGTYVHNYKGNTQLTMELKGDQFEFKSESKSGYVNFKYRFNFHVDENNVIVLDKVLDSKDKDEAEYFMKPWNDFKVEIKNNTIYFYQEFNRNEELMEFKKEKS